MFYTFRQNNSGGYFVDNENVCATVIVEADSSQEANERAESIEIYFDGCARGLDCSCCGDRWYEIWGDEKGYETPSIYGKSVYEKKRSFFDEKCYIYRKDGTKEVVVFPND